MQYSWWLYYEYSLNPPIQIILKVRSLTGTDLGNVPEALYPLAIGPNWWYFLIAHRAGLLKQSSGYGAGLGAFHQVLILSDKTMVTLCDLDGLKYLQYKL